MIDFYRSPVIWILIVIIIAIHFTGPDRWIDCNTHTTCQNMIHALIHQEKTHLLLNVWALYNLRTLEQSYGTPIFLGLMGTLWVITSWWLTYLPKMVGTENWPFPRCGFGLSAVLLGFTVFDRLNLNHWIIDNGEIGNLALMLIIPLIRNPQVSLSGHIAGILTGIMLSIVPRGLGIQL